MFIINKIEQKWKINPNIMLSQGSGQKMLFSFDSNAKLFDTESLGTYILYNLKNFGMLWSNINTTTG